MPKFRSHEIHIWSSTFTGNYKDISHFEFVLSEDEIEKAADFISIPIQKKWIISRGILRNLLSMYLNLRPTSVEIFYGLYGKPQVSNDFSLYFNVSHSNDYIIIALSHSVEVGIDIEFIDPTLKVENLVSGILHSPEEIDFWRGVSQQDRLESFYKLWVCKEAFLKMHGQGWSRDNYHLPIQTLNYLKFRKADIVSSSIEVPYIFKPVPEYISALFTKGAQCINPIHYTWSFKKNWHC
jgi:4'-phosphopantetheinyl transferase